MLDSNSKPQHIKNAYFRAFDSPMSNCHSIKFCLEIVFPHLRMTGKPEHASGTGVLAKSVRVKRLVYPVLINISLYLNETRNGGRE